MKQNEAKRIAVSLKSELALFTGTTQYHRNFLGLRYTDGIQYLAERAGAYWLIDAIASWQPQAGVVEEEFQLWELAVHYDQSADLTGRVDSGQPAIAHQRIEYTDFPLRSITFYVQNGVLMLPSEY